MHTVDLNLNKLLVTISLAFAVMCILLARLELTPVQPLMFFGFSLITIVSVFTVLVYANRFFVHIDKAGVSYGVGFTVKYIHQESIKTITKKHIVLGEVLQVEKLDGKSTYFYAWQINDNDFAKAQRLLAL